MRILIFLFSLLSLESQAQFQPVNSYILKDFVILDSLSGDINNDKIKDIVLILKHNQEEDNFDTTRPLLLLEGNITKKTSADCHSRNTIMKKSIRF